jgi:hypothetical protein
MAATGWKEHGGRITDGVIPGLLQRILPLGRIRTDVHAGRPIRKQVLLVSVSHRTASARPGPPKDRVPAPAPPSPAGWRRWVVPLGVAIVFVAVLFFNPFAITGAPGHQNDHERLGPRR